MNDAKPAVLVVDDEAGNRLLLAEILAEDYKVILAKNGTQALRRVAQHRPRIVLLDVFMPDMDGFEVMDALSRDERACAVPLVFMTTPDTLSAAQRERLSQAADFIRKPLEAEIVREVVRRNLTG